MKFEDIKKFPFASYTVNLAWKSLKFWIEDHSKNPEFMRCDMNPFFQRNYVWTNEQKISYIEYQLKGGFSGRDIFWNCPTWMSFKDKNNILQLVDGKQRLNSVLEFLDNKIRVFGNLYFEFEDRFPPFDPSFIFHVNNLKSERDVVEWYVGFNTGGSIHTKEDLKPALDYLNRFKEELLQTFMPYDDYKKSMESLDKKRLGNQVWREGLTLLRGKWQNHPASKMWKGYEYHLGLYLLEGLKVLKKRNGKDYIEIKNKIKVEMQKFKNTGRPSWMGNKMFHSSHKSSLLRKNKEHYSQFGWTEPDNLPYVWPVL